MNKSNYVFLYCSAVLVKSERAFGKFERAADLQRSKRLMLSRADAAAQQTIAARVGTRTRRVFEHRDKARLQRGPTPTAKPPFQTSTLPQLQTISSSHISIPLWNPTAHYPVHCIRVLIFSFTSCSEERSASMINPLYSNK